MDKYIYTGVVLFLLLGAGCSKNPVPIEDNNEGSAQVEQKSQVNYMPEVKPIDGPDVVSHATSTAPENVETTQKPATNNQAPTPKPAVRYDANGFPLNPLQMQKFTASNGETYYYVDGVWTHEDYVYPYHDLNGNTSNSAGENYSGDNSAAIVPDSLPANDTTTDSQYDENGFPSHPYEMQKFTTGGNTYYYVDGVWTHEDYVYPYQN